VPSPTRLCTEGQGCWPPLLQPQIAPPTFGTQGRAGRRGLLELGARDQRARIAGIRDSRRTPALARARATRLSVAELSLHAVGAEHHRFAVDVQVYAPPCRVWRTFCAALFADQVVLIVCVGHAATSCSPVAADRHSPNAPFERSRPPGAGNCGASSAPAPGSNLGWQRLRFAAWRRHCTRLRNESSRGCSEGPAPPVGPLYRLARHRIGEMFFEPRGLDTYGGPDTNYESSGFTWILRALTACWRVCCCQRRAFGPRTCSRSASTDSAARDGDRSCRALSPLIEGRPLCIAATPKLASLGWQRSVRPQRGFRQDQRARNVDRRELSDGRPVWVRPSRVGGPLGDIRHRPSQCPGWARGTANAPPMGRFQEAVRQIIRLHARPRRVPGRDRAPDDLSASTPSAEGQGMPLRATRSM
jgi:hypothetical protein